MSKSSLLHTRGGDRTTGVNAEMIMGLRNSIRSGGVRTGVSDGRCTTEKDQDVRESPASSTGCVWLGSIRTSRDLANRPSCRSALAAPMSSWVRSELVQRRYTVSGSCCGCFGHRSFFSATRSAPLTAACFCSGRGSDWRAAFADDAQDYQRQRRLRRPAVGLAD